MTASQPDLDQLIATLGDSANRDSVPSDLRKYGETAVAPLIAALESDDEDTRHGVLWAINRVRESLLGALLAPAAIAPLAAIVQHDSSSRIRLQALKTLMVLAGPDDHKTVVKALLAALADDQEPIRAEAARSLTQMNDTEALEPLAKLVENDPAEKVRGRAAYALAYLDPDLAALKNSGGAGSDALMIALGDSELSVRLRVIWALGEMKNAKALQPLAEILENGKTTQEQRKAAEALATIGDPKALEPLTVALQFSGDEGIKRSAAEALGKLGDTGAVEILLHTLRHEPQPAVRASAARALESLADASATDDLIAALEDSSDDVQLRATLALGAIGDKRAVEPLKTLIAHTDSHQIRAAASQVVDSLEEA